MGGILLALGLVLAAALPAHAAQPPPVEQLLKGAETGEPCQQPAPEGCKRLRYYFGPLPVTPGNNFQLFGPAVIEKPLVDGYVTRLEPDLVRADGSVPPTEQLHLHHVTWLNGARGGLTCPSSRPARRRRAGCPHRPDLGREEGPGAAPQAQAAARVGDRRGPRRQRKFARNPSGQDAGWLA